MYLMALRVVVNKIQFCIYGMSMTDSKGERRRGAVLLSNFLWQPIDTGTINMGIKLIAPDFPTVDFHALYV